MYYKRIVLSNIDEISNYFSDIVNGYSDTSTNTIIWLDDTNISWLTEHLDVKCITDSNPQIIGAFLFMVVPNNNPDCYHVDGTNVNDESQNWALNIPISNCDKGEMIWADGDYDLIKKEENGIPWLELLWHELPTIVESAIIDTPCIVKINTPHKVINHKNLRRVMLTIRFDSNIT